jgi:hypothetical protein
MTEISKTQTIEPGARAGQAQEFCTIVPMKPGGADRIRAALRDPNNAKYLQQSVIDKVGTVHDFRMVFFDNDTRLLFASTFDGTWEDYIDDFATYIPDIIDFQFNECEGWPGIKNPAVKDYIRKHQIPASLFYSAYPQATVRDIWKGLKTKAALDNLLDTAGEG